MRRVVSASGERNVRLIGCNKWLMSLAAAGARDLVRSRAWIIYSHGTHARTLADYVAVRHATYLFRSLKRAPDGGCGKASWIAS